MSDDRIDRLIDQAADITQQMIANRDKRVSELTDEVSRLNDELSQLRPLVYSYPPATYSPDGVTWQQECERVRSHARVMARELEAWRNDDAQHGHSGETRRHDFPEDCAVCTACSATDAAIPDLSVYTKEQS